MLHRRAHRRSFWPCVVAGFYIFKIRPVQSIKMVILSGLNTTINWISSEVLLWLNIIKMWRSAVHFICRTIYYSIAFNHPHCNAGWDSKYTYTCTYCLSLLDKSSFTTLEETVRRSSPDWDVHTEASYAKLCLSVSFMCTFLFLTKFQLDQLLPLAEMVSAVFKATSTKSL